MSEDDAIARAIALSLQEQGAASKPIVIDSDDEEAGNQVDDGDKRFERDLKRALEASRVESSRQPEVVEVSPEPSATPLVVHGGSAMPGFLSERAQMEKERRERQMKRRREAGLDVEDESRTQGRAESVDSDDGGMEPPTKRQHLSSSSSFSDHANMHSAYSSSAGSSSSTRELPLIDQMFWDGEVRPTMNQYALKTDTRKKFTLTEAIGPKGDLSFAIIASYVASVAWIYEFFDPSVPVIFVTQPDPSGNAAIKNILPNWIKTVPFLRNGYGCMHMKFMLLFHKTGRLRVIISTANLIDYDYRDIENALWIQDIPRLPTPRKAKKAANPDDFPSMFTRVLKALNVPPALSTFLKTDHPDLPLQSLDDLCTHWDWSKVNVLLVPSIAGKHEGWPQVIRSGHPRLMMAIRKMGLSKKSAGMTLECQGSSIGHYTTQWMNEFYLSSTGQSTEKWLDQTKRKREAMPYPPIKIMYPSLKTVRATVMGERGAGTMFCLRKSWEAPNFPRKLFHDSNSKAGGVLMHTKMIIGLVKPTSQSNSANSSSSRKQTSRQEENDFGSAEEESDDDEVQIVQGHQEAIGWAYVGSHNFTPSAWGTLSGSSFTPVLNIKNYELGIVFPLKDEAEVESVACWQRPPRKYVSGDDRPWIQAESEFFQQNE